MDVIIYVPNKNDKKYKLIHFIAEFGCLFKLAKKEEMIYVITDAIDEIAVNLNSDELTTVLNKNIYNGKCIYMFYMKLLSESDKFLYSIYIKNYNIDIFLLKNEIIRIEICKTFHENYRFILPILEEKVEISGFDFFKKLGVFNEYDLFKLKDNEKDKFFNTLIEEYNKRRKRKK